MLTPNFMYVTSFTTLDDALFLNMQLFFNSLNLHAHIDTTFILERNHSDSFISSLYALFSGFSIDCMEQLLANSLYYYIKVLSHFEINENIPIHTYDCIQCEAQTCNIPITCPTLIGNMLRCNQYCNNFDECRFQWMVDMQSKFSI